MDKQHPNQRKEQLLELTGKFCHKHLDKDYLQLCRKLIGKMSRKRPVPFATGRIEIWAAAVIHALGTKNFLFDKSFEPYVSATDLSSYFGTANNTVSAKSKVLREMFKLDYFNTEFATGHLLRSSPVLDLVVINGKELPMLLLPSDLQEAIKKAREETGRNEFVVYEEE